MMTTMLMVMIVMMVLAAHIALQGRHDDNDVDDDHGSSHCLQIKVRHDDDDSDEDDNGHGSSHSA
eukprot:10579325-Karenia_brevis.AAC.1